jgi:hypothetical protein
MDGHPGKGRRIAVAISARLLIAPKAMIHKKAPIESRNKTPLNMAI